MVVPIRAQPVICRFSAPRAFRLRNIARRWDAPIKRVEDSTVFQIRQQTFSRVVDRHANTAPKSRQLTTDPSHAEYPQLARQTHQRQVTVVGPSPSLCSDRI